MNKVSAFTLKKRRDASIIISIILLFLFICFVVLHFIFTELGLLFTLIETSAVCMFISLLLSSVFTSGIHRRIDYLVFKEMNSALLEQELPVFFKILGRSSEGRFKRYLYEGLIKMIDGKHKDALMYIKEAKFKPSDMNYVSICYYKVLLLLRTGMINEAESEFIVLKKTIIHQLSFTYLEALLHLEKGEIAEAKKLNDIDYYTSPFHEMYVRFDLGRLDEILGKYDNAINNYQQAATLGPKTWLGQEAGRRLSVLTAKTEVDALLQ